jgi:ribonucleoside-diphosphate reductase alpha chain
LVEGEYSNSEDILQRIAKVGSCQGIVMDGDDYWDYLKKVFVTAHDVSPVWHVSMQATFQRHVDLGISKTINLPSEASLEDVKEAFLLAYELGCKGITVYRNESRHNQVLTTGSE